MYLDGVYGVTVAFCHVFVQERSAIGAAVRDRKSGDVFQDTGPSSRPTMPERPRPGLCVCVCVCVCVVCMRMCVFVWVGCIRVCEKVCEL